MMGGSPAVDTGILVPWSRSPRRLRHGIVIIPTITGDSPASGPAAGGTIVTLTGTKFDYVTSVFFGTTEVTTFNYIDATTPHCRIPRPMQPGPVDLTGRNPDTNLSHILR